MRLLKHPLAAICGPRDRGNRRGRRPAQRRGQGQPRLPAPTFAITARDAGRAPALSGVPAPTSRATSPAATSRSSSSRWRHPSGTEATIADTTVRGHRPSHGAGRARPRLRGRGHRRRGRDDLPRPLPAAGLPRVGLRASAARRRRPLHGHVPDEPLAASSSTRTAHRAGGTARPSGRSAARSRRAARCCGRGRSATATASTRRWPTRSTASTAASSATSTPTAAPSSTPTSTTRSRTGPPISTATSPATRSTCSRFGGPRRAAVVDAEIEQLDPEATSSGAGTRSTTSRSRRRRAGGRRSSRSASPAPTACRSTTRSTSTRSSRGATSSSPPYRHLDALYGIDRQSGDILWKMGGTPRPESIRGRRRPLPRALRRPARLRGSGATTCSASTTTASPRSASRAASSSRLEPEKGKATFIRQFTDPTIPESRCCGSMRPFAGGWLDRLGRHRVGHRVRRVAAGSRSGCRFPAPPTAPSRSRRQQATLEISRPASRRWRIRRRRRKPPAEEPCRRGAGADNRPVVLLIHGGSWLRGRPPAMDIPARSRRPRAAAGVDRVPARRRRGGRTPTVRRIAESWRDRGHDVVAFGESAGGQIATLLAAEGRVDYAVGNAPVSDLLRYWEGDEQEFWDERLGADEATRRELSPRCNRRTGPCSCCTAPRIPASRSTCPSTTRGSSRRSGSAGSAAATSSTATAAAAITTTATAASASPGWRGRRASSPAG